VSAPPNGLPETLPQGERLLWQGAPDWRVFARRAFHTRKLAAYFGLIVIWVVASSIASNAPFAETAMAALRGVGLSLVPLVLISVYAWAVARSTVYTITDRRVAMRVGLALPVNVNLPFAEIGGASMVREDDGSGNIALTLNGKDRLAYLVVWPHARPWRMTKVEPMLRGLRDVQPVAQLLARALAASADMSAPVLDAKTATGAKMPHATMPA
jgi:hypothetical protein